VLGALHAFMAAKEPISFSVLGMTSTGKSRLLAELVSEAENAGRSFIKLAPNRRLAWLARKRTGIEMGSVYGHLYAGLKEGDDGGKAEVRNQLKVIPLRVNTDPENCVYVFDDAHLLGNSRFSTPDGKQYGSGQLLSDFIEFAKLGQSSRKVIFFGDPYQIQRSGDESVLSGEFQKSRGLKHQSLELEQLVNTERASTRMLNAERLVTSIRAKSFAWLNLVQGVGLRVLDNRAAAAEITERFRDEPTSAWYLAETHARVNDFSRWLRRRLLGTTILGRPVVGDLLEVYVWPEDLSAEFPAGDRRLHSGDRFRVAAVGRRVPYEQVLKGRESPILFHSVECEVEGMKGPAFTVFEEFLTSDKPELDADTAIAERVMRASRRETTSGMPRTPKDVGSTNTVEPPLPNFAYVRYGYASTVHHAQGMPHQICYLNCDHAASRHSEAFFRWLYSALTVAEDELALLNFVDIHPFDEAEWNANAATEDPNVAVGAGWSSRHGAAASEEDQRRELPPGLREAPDPLKSAAIWLQVTKAIERHGWQVSKAACHPYVEQYEIAGPQGERGQLSIAYNGKHVVTAMHAKEPALWPILLEAAQACIESHPYTAEADFVLRSARIRLAPGNWRVVSAAESAYRLAVALARAHNERVEIEIYFDKQGLVSSLRPRRYSDVVLLEEIRSLLL
jgi:hypothetical protein